MTDLIVRPGRAPIGTALSAADTVASLIRPAALGPVPSAKVPSRAPGKVASTPPFGLRARDWDPRWVLTPQGQLTPAMTYLLMTGEQPDVRLRGWVRLAQHEPDVALMLKAYRGTLIAEAERSGFVPFWERKKVPKGEGFEQWRKSFVATHRY